MLSFLERIKSVLCEFRHLRSSSVVEDFVLVGYSTASLGDRLPTLRGNLRVKVKVIPAHAVKAFRGNGGVAPLI